MTPLEQRPGGAGDGHALIAQSEPTDSEVEAELRSRYEVIAANARLFAVVNAAIGDAGILARDDKYFYDLWRPVLGIREHDPSTGPTAVGGNVLDPDADPGWLPLGAQSTNNVGAKNTTPNFPAYPSGHATIGAAVFQSVKCFYDKGGDRSDKHEEQLVLSTLIPLSSSETNATGRRGSFVRDAAGPFRISPASLTAKPSNLQCTWQAIEENSLSRVFLGVVQPDRRPLRSWPAASVRGEGPAQDRLVPR